MANPDQETGRGDSQYKPIESTQEPLETRGKVFSRRGFLKMGAKTVGLGAGLLAAKQLGIPLDTLARAAIRTEWVFDPSWFKELEMTEDEVRRRPQKIQAFTELVLPDGTEERFAAVNNTLGGPEKDIRNTIIYRAVAEPGAPWTKYIPILEAPGRVVNVIRATQGRPDELVLGGDETWGGQITFVTQCSDSGGKWSCRKIALPAETKGAVTELLETPDGFIVNNGNLPGKVALLHIPRDSVTGLLGDAKPVMGGPGWYLRSSAMPRAISTSNPDTFKVLGLGWPGLALTTIDLGNNTGDREPFFAGELGYVDEWVDYIDAEGKRNMIVINPLLQLLSRVSADSSGRPTEIKYTRSFSQWVDNKGIPGYQKGTLNLIRHWVGVDSQGLAHLWFLMGMQINGGGQSGIGIGHVLEGADPNKDEKALSWRPIGPADLRLAFNGGTQAGIAFRPSRGQNALEFPVDGPAGWPSKFGTIVRYPIGRDYEPLPDAQEIYLSAGLGEPLPPVAAEINFRSYLPTILKRFFAGW